MAARHSVCAIQQESSAHPSNVPPISGWTCWTLTAWTGKLHHQTSFLHHRIAAQTKFTAAIMVPALTTAKCKSKSIISTCRSLRVHEKPLRALESRASAYATNRFFHSSVSPTGPSYRPPWRAATKSVSAKWETFRASQTALRFQKCHLKIYLVQQSRRYSLTRPMTTAAPFGRAQIPAKLVSAFVKIAYQASDRLSNASLAPLINVG